MLAWTMALLAATQTPPPPDPVLARMVALYDEVCLKAFPIDAGVDALMAEKHATALTPEQVKIYLHDDPGRGWALPDGAQRFVITVEAAPWHACTVRRMTAAGFADLAPYRSLADGFEQAHPAFTPVAPYEADLGIIHSHGVGEQRLLPGGSVESLFVFDNHVVDPGERARGATAVEMRFVHQIKSPEAR